MYSGDAPQKGSPMTISAGSTPPGTGTLDPRLFPFLTPPQIARLAAHGRHRTIRPGEVLAETGDRTRPVFVVPTGALAIARQAAERPEIVTRLGPGQFTGDVGTLAGRPALVCI